MSAPFLKLAALVACVIAILVLGSKNAPDGWLVFIACVAVVIVWVE